MTNRYGIIIVSRLGKPKVTDWQDPASVGTAFKTISMRIRGAKTEMEAAGLETEGMVESTAKLREEIMALTGVDIMLNENEFKSTYAIMEELANKWKDLTDIQQASVTELIAGKRQGNIVSSLMTNFNIAEDALKTSLDSSGSAMKEHEKWQQSLEARLLKLQAAWQNLSQTFLSSDFLKSLLDGVINLVQWLEKLIDNVGVLPTLFAGFATYKGITGKIFSFDKNNKSMSLFGTNIQKASKAIGLYNKHVDKADGSHTRFSNKISSIIPSFASYTSGLNGAKASMGGYAKSLVAGAAKSAAMSAATGLLQGGLIALASVAISAVVSWVDKLIVTSDELAEKVDKITANYKDQHSELIKNKSNFESMTSKYAELSKGVDGLGRNVSLTADEYSEYQSVVNDIANQIPSLVSGYDSQGNAILNCKGNVEELTDAYNKLIKAQNDEIISNAGDIQKDWKNTLEKANKTNAFDDKLTTDGYKALEKMVNGGYSKEQITAYLDKNEGMRQEIIKALQSAGIEGDIGFFSGRDDYDSFIADAIKNNSNAVKSIIGDYEATLLEEAAGMKSVAEAVLSNAFDIGDTEYSGMSEQLQNLARQVVSNFDLDFYSEFDEDSLRLYVSNMLDSLNSLSDSDNAEFEAALNLQTKFNNGDVSYGEYVNGLERAKSFIEGLNLDDEVEEQILLSLNVEEVTKDYDALKKRLTSDEYNIQMKTEEAEAFLDSLTASEYAVAVDLMMSGEVDLSDFDIESLRTYIKEQAKLQEAMNFTIAMDVETESIEALNTAMAESVSGAGLSSEAIAALKVRYAELESQGYNLSAMFEETANGIHLNREAVAEFEQKLAEDKLAETEGHLDVLKNRYDELTVEIDNCTDASERAGLYREQQDIVDKINDLGTLASQYEGLASAYQKWQNIESAGSERDMYEGIIEGFENIEDELSRGWLDDGTIAFLELLTGKTDLASKSGKELKEIYDDLDETIKNTSYSVSDFFTVDDDGNSTNAGVYNFLDAIGQLEEEKFGGKNVVERDDSGNVIGFDFELVAQKDEKGNVIKNGDQVIAEALGISEELVQIMVRASDDAGFVVNLEGAYTQLADLKTEAESARDTLISLKKKGLDELKNIKLEDLNFNFEATGDDLVAEQEKAVKLLDKFKKNGKVDLKMEGAQEALDIAEYLTIKLDDLTEPKFMQIDTSEIDEDLRDPIEKIQEIGDLCKQKHLVTVEGDTEEINEVQGKIDEVAKDLAALDENTKKEIGIDVNWDSKTIADKIEKGEIEIPAELELDVQMSDDLKDMRLMMMNQLGLVSDNEVKLKIGYDIDDSTVDLLSEDKKEIVIEYISENEEEFNKLTKEKQKILIEYIAENEKEFNDMTDDEREVFVKYIADGGDIEKFDEYIDKEKNIKVIAETFGEKDVEGLSEALKDVDSTKVQAVAEALGKKDVDALSEAIDGMEDNEATALAHALGYKDVEDLKASIANMKGNEVDAEVNTDGQAGKIDTLQSEIDGMHGTRVDILVGIKKAASSLWNWVTNTNSTRIDNKNGQNGVGGVDGTAHVDGTTGRAFNRGNWGTRSSGTALVGELGRETLVRNGRYYTIGDNGAEFIKYQKDDIIFNHKQTEELFKNGKITSGGGRGKALVGGTAFLEGTAFDTGSTGSGGGLGYSGSGSSAKDYGSKKASEARNKSKDTKDEFEETFDWIEVAISRIERAIDQLDQKANRTYKSWSSRNYNLTKEISKVRSEINLQERAYSGYMAEANSVGLSSKWRNRVQDGTIDISTIKDEDLAEKISQYTEWYNKALECKDAILDLQDTEAELYKQKFDNVASKYDAKIERYNSKKSIAEQNIEKSNYRTSVGSLNNKNYKTIVSQEKNTISQLKKEKKELESALDKAVKSGAITKYSEDWYEMMSTIDDVALSIEESTNNISKAYSDMFDSIADKYDATLGNIDSKKSSIEQHLEQSKYTTNAKSLNGNSYRKLITQEENTIAQLKKKKKEQESSLKSAINSGAVKKYSKEWYEMRAEIDATTLSIKEATTNISKYYVDMFDMVSEKYDAMLQSYEHTGSMLDEYVSQAEAKGHIVSKKYYEALVNNEKNNISTLKKEQADLIKARDEAVKSGDIKKGSLEWYNMCAEIDAVTQALEESTTQLIEFDNAMREIDWSVFDLIQERISGVTAEADFLIELMSNDKLFDDKGKMTNQGIATTALHAQNYNTHMYQADDYGSEVAKLDKQIKKDPYDQELINRRNELLELQRESILAAEDEKKAIVSLIEEGIEIELDALQELIDKKNEELESERDLYEYQKKVKEQTKEIADIEKQMSAYSGDDSEEAQAKIQELKLSLEEAEADLKETEYDKYISDQQALLDTLYLEYETILNQRLDNVDALLSQVIDAVNAAATGEISVMTEALGEGGAIATILGGALGNEGVIGTILGGAFGEAGEGGSFKSILSTLKTETKSVGTTLSTAMKNIWSVGEGNAKSVLTMYGQGFQNKQTTTNTTLSNIKVGIDKMVTALNKEATTKTSANKTSSSSKKDPTKNTTTKKTSTKTTTTKKTTTKTTTTKKTTTKKSSGGDGKAKIGDKVKFVSGKYYYDSYGTSPSGYYKRGDYVYITHINKSGSHPYHISTGSKLGKGDLGWLKLSQLSGYFTGKRKILNNEYAWTQEKGAEFIVRPSDGAILTPVAKNDSVLNAAASSNIWNMANSPAEFIKDNLGLGMSNIPNDSNVQNSYNQTIESIVFSMPNVKNYDEMLRAMQRDKDFEKLILSMSIDRIAGKSSLAKNKVLK